MAAVPGGRLGGGHWLVRTRIQHAQLSPRAPDHSLSVCAWAYAMHSCLALRAKNRQQLLDPKRALRKAGHACPRTPARYMAICLGATSPMLTLSNNTTSPANPSGELKS